jgi:hypothetical protein
VNPRADMANINEIVKLQTSRNCSTEKDIFPNSTLTKIIKEKSVHIREKKTDIALLFLNGVKTDLGMAFIFISLFLGFIISYPPYLYYQYYIKLLEKSKFI